MDTNKDNSLIKYRENIDNLIIYKKENKEIIEELSNDIENEYDIEGTAHEQISQLSPTGGYGALLTNLPIVGPITHNYEVGNIIENYRKLILNNHVLPLLNQIKEETKLLININNDLLIRIKGNDELYNSTNNKLKESNNNYNTLSDNYIEINNKYSELLKKLEGEKKKLFQARFQKAIKTDMTIELTQHEVLKKRIDDLEEELDNYRKSIESKDKFIEDLQKSLQKSEGSWNNGLTKYNELLKTYNEESDKYIRAQLELKQTKDILNNNETLLSNAINREKDFSNLYESEKNKNINLLNELNDYKERLKDKEGIFIFTLKKYTKYHLITNKLNAFYSKIILIIILPIIFYTFYRFIGWIVYRINKNREVLIKVLRANIKHKEDIIKSLKSHE